MTICRWLPLAAAVACTSAHACDDTRALTSHDPALALLISEGTAHVPAPGDNTGVYQWNDELGAHVLRRSWFDPDRLSFPISIQSGDHVDYLPPSNGAGEESLLCEDDPATLDTVQVTAPPNVRRGAFIRTIGFGGVSGGRLAVSRARVRLQTEPLCAGTPEERSRNVGEVVKFENMYTMGGPLQAMEFCASNSGHGLEYETTLAGGSGYGVYRWTGQCNWGSNDVYLTEVRAPTCQ